MQTEQESRHLEDSVREVDLPRAASLAWSQLDEAAAGHTAVTLAKRPGLSVVLLALKKGSSIPEHRTDGEISVQVLSGRIRFHVAGQEFEMGRGRMLTVASDLLHDLEADEDSQVLLTVAGCHDVLLRT